MMNVKSTNVLNYTPSGFGKNASPQNNADNFGDVLAQTKKKADSFSLFPSAKATSYFNSAARINENTATYSLTAEQIEYLRGKYDFASMTSIPKELLNDLADMNVINRDETNFSFMLPEYEGEGTEHKNSTDIMWKMSDSISRLQNRLAFSSNSARSDFISGIIESRNRLLDVITKLMQTDIPTQPSVNSTILTARETSPYSQNTSLMWHTDEEKNNINKITAYDDYEERIQAQRGYMEEIIERTKDTIGIRLGKNELPVFIEYLEKGLAKGEDLVDVLRAWQQKTEDSLKNHDWNKDPNLFGLDTFFIDPNTGTVKHANPAGISLRGILPKKQSGDTPFPVLATGRDVNAVWDLAFDLQQFLRYTFFKQEGDCPEDVDRILAEIKERQNYKCTCRFDDFETANSLEIALTENDEFGDIDKLIDKDMLEKFIEMIEKHQDKLHTKWIERIKEMQAAQSFHRICSAVRQHGLTKTS
jgi:hypothetical protein